MARPRTPPILARLGAAASVSAQAAVLRDLKDEIIGTEQKKEAWIRLGMIPHLLPILSEAWRTKPEAAETRAYQPDASIPMEASEEARLQATIIAGSLANGGPAFVAPLLSTPIVSALLPSLDPATVSARLLLETLRTLNAIADALALNPPGAALQEGTLSDVLFSTPHAPRLRDVLSQTSPRPIVQQQISLAARLIAKICRDEHHRTALANAGVLDALGSRLAGFVMATGFVLPGVEHVASGAGGEPMPRPATPAAELYPILDAISSIIHDSKFRASQLLYAPEVTAVFPPLSVDFAEPDQQFHSTAVGTANVSDPSVSNPIDILLPRTGYVHPKSVPAHNSAFPPLSSATGGSRGPSKSRHSTWLYDHIVANSTARGVDAGLLDDEESPVVAWLICLTRAERGLNRLMAAQLLAELYRIGLVSKRRENTLALVVVPLLLRMLDDPSTLLVGAGKYPPSNDPRWIQRIVKERVPAIMAMLVTDSVELQKAAVDGHAIEKLSLMLKVAHDPVAQVRQTTPWNPSPENRDISESNQASSASRLGDPGLSPQLVHNLKVREGTLQGLASLAPFLDEYRKKIIENGVINVLLESLKGWEDGPSSEFGQAVRGGPSESRSSSSNSPKGNPASVQIAACNLARALSRSVSILRTSLIDAGIASPLFALLKSPDIEVQIAATAPICNLILEFSPMREAIVQAGALKVLCVHAQSPNPRLRLNAAWALKHLVLSPNHEVKVACLKELGTSGLIQLLCGNTDETTATLGGGSNDLMDSSMEMLKDPIEPEDIGIAGATGSLELFGQKLERDDDPGKMDLTRSRTSVETSRPDSSRHAKSPSTVSAKLAALREAEMNLVRKARRDEVAVQEQGLDFIRNIIHGPKSDEIIDFLFTNLGQDRIFEILASKLRGQPVQDDRDGGTNNRRSLHRHKDTSSNSRAATQQAHAEIIVSVLFILVHIAASQPRHRQLLTNQTHLLKLLLPLFRHPSKYVRAPLVYFLTNMTFDDDHSDEAACKSRAAELRRLGFQAELEALLHDPDLDIRERAKAALWQIKAGLNG